MENTKTRIILKVGGSILSIAGKNGCLDFDVSYTQKLCKLLLKHNVDAGMVVGGGYINKYMLNIIYSKHKDLNDPTLVNRYHHIRIASLNLNANMFLTVFIQTIKQLNKDKKIKILKEVIAYRDFEFLDSLNLDKLNYFVAGAYKPGHSSDMDALLLAVNSGADTVISLKNVDGVYSEDPTQNKDAKFFDRLTWDEYLDIIKVKTFAPRGNFPVDPVTAQKAKELNIKFIIVQGDKFLDFMPKIIKGDDNWKGTIIS